jgi:hypothetical protein
VVGCNIGSKEVVPEERKHVIRHDYDDDADDDDDDDDNNGC